MHIDREMFRSIGQLRLSTPGVATGQRQGDRRSPYRGRGVEFADYRPYTPGDDLRLVDWNIYARLETVLIRLFQEDRNLSVHIHVDLSASMNFGTPNKAEHAGGLAATLVLLGLLNRDHVSLSCSGEGVGRGKVTGENTHSFHRFLDLLERAEPKGVAAPWRRISKHTRPKRPDRLFVISDLLYEDQDRERMLKATALGGRSAVLFHVLSQEELNPQLDDPIEALDSETGKILHVKSGAAARRAYQKNLNSWLENIKKRSRSLGVLVVPAYNNVPVRELLQNTLRKKRLVSSASGGAA